MSEHDNKQSTGRETTPLSETDIPPAQGLAVPISTPDESDISPTPDPALPASVPTEKKRFWTRSWDKLDRESNPIQALTALVTLTVIAYGVIYYRVEEPQRRQERQQASHYTAWQIINSATGQRASGGRIEALQELNKDNVSLEGLIAPSAKLSEIKLPNANLQDANLLGAYLISANLQRANLQRANLLGAYLISAKLQHAKLQHAVLQDAFLQGVDLQCAYLPDASLFNINLQGAYLISVNLQRANLQYAKLQNAKLQNARLQNAKLQNAKLQHANLQFTNLRLADLTAADLANADFRYSTNLTANQIRLAKNWHLALFDADLKEELGLP